MEKIISPGVFTRENDQSFLSKGIEEIGAAIIGPTAKGQALVPVNVTTYSEYVSKFGSTFKSGSDYYQYLTSHTAKEYFDNGGKTLTLVRVLSGSYSSATSIVNSPIQISASFASASFTLDTISQGNLMNNSGSENSGSLVSGSRDNIRWEISNTNISTGTFTLLVRRGDDNTKSKVVLESWTNLTLDPTSNNYISKVIGDQYQVFNASEKYVQSIGAYPNYSKYVRVSSVLAQTPNYFDNLGNFNSNYTASLPSTGSGSFSGGNDGLKSPGQAYFYDAITNTSTNSQGYTSEAYLDAINLLSNKDEYDFNLLLLPGLVAANPVTSLGLSSAIDMVEGRGDAFVVIDTVGYGSNLSTVLQTSTSFNTNYAGTYWPWVQLRDAELSKNVWVPASTIIGGTFAFNDQVGAEWFAPAGLTRGGLPSVIQTERKLSHINRDELYASNINPIASFPSNGIVVFGQKTLQKRESALNRINVRRLLITVRKFLASSSRYLVFDQNTIATRNKFLSIANPYLESIVQRQGLYAYKVVMDDSNNTNDVIDRNQIVGQVYLQPTRTAEFIVLDFNIMPTGASFPEN